MKKLFAVSALAGVAFMSVPAQADDGGQVSLGLAALSSSTASNIESGGQSFDAEEDLGFGLAGLLGVHLSPRFALESGVLWVNRNADFSGPGFELTQEQEVLQVPLLLRFYPLEFLNVGAGVYAGFDTGDVENNFTTGGPDDVGFDLTGGTGNEYGWMLAAALNFNLGEDTELFVEGRYTNPETNLIDSDAVERSANDVLALAGLKFEIGG